ncbi:MAG: hypothetical protein IPI58_03725 [Alphaproteobacteria bacterium]|nr:MAG: hypothetical protein IPI58_03725 [Alphaproteobacteria bacterium]
MAGRASFYAWRHWARILERRLTTVALVYRQHAYLDRAARAEQLRQRLANGFLPVERAHIAPRPGIPGTDDPVRLQELAIYLARDALVEALQDMPLWSQDMQRLMECSWQSESACDRITSELFHGPAHALDEGIGSGYPADGQLPSVIEDLIESESLSGDRLSDDDDSWRRSRGGTRQGEGQGKGAGDHAPPPLIEAAQDIDDQPRRRWLAGGARQIRPPGQVE